MPIIHDPIAGSETPGTSHTILDSQDISCTRAKVAVAFDGGPVLSTTSAGWTLTGQARVFTGSPVGGGYTYHATLGVFEKVGPGVEELIVETSTSSVFSSGILSRIDDPWFATATSGSADPPAALPLNIAYAATDGGIVPTAGPDGYSGFTTEASIGLGPSMAAAHGDGDPGPFTSDSGKSVAATVRA